ncbi:hypothetical protein H4R33_001524 [Dimargaris cristalligena]|nr:hypothetical protein H4R33_001524 [Dimargaris cristalligena]
MVESQRPGKRQNSSSATTTISTTTLSTSQLVQSRLFTPASRNSPPVAPSVTALPYWSKLRQWVSTFEAHRCGPNTAAAAGSLASFQPRSSSRSLLTRLSSRPAGSPEPFMDLNTLLPLLEAVVETLKATRDANQCLELYPDIRILLVRLLEYPELMVITPIRMAIRCGLLYFSHLGSDRPQALGDSDPPPIHSARRWAAHLLRTTEVSPLISANRRALRILDSSGQSLPHFQECAARVMLQNLNTRLERMGNQGAVVNLFLAIVTVFNLTRNPRFFGYATMLLIYYHIRQAWKSRHLSTGFTNLLTHRGTVMLVTLPSFMDYRLRNLSHLILEYEELISADSPWCFPLQSWCLGFINHIRSFTLIRKTVSGPSRELLGALRELPDATSLFEQCLPPRSAQLVRALIGPLNISPAEQIRRLNFLWHRYSVPMTQDPRAMSDMMCLWGLAQTNPAHRRFCVVELLENRGHRSASHTNACLEFLAYQLHPTANPVLHQTLVQDLDEMLLVFHEMIMYSLVPRAVDALDRDTWLDRILEFCQTHTAKSQSHYESAHVPFRKRVSALMASLTRVYPDSH